METSTVTPYATPDPEFTGVMSSDDLWYAGEINIRLTDVIDEKVDINHSHSEYAVDNHTHSDYAETDHTHTEYAETDHTHDYALSTHAHTQSDVSDLSDTLATKADLVDGKVPTSQLPGYVDDVIEYPSFANFPTAAESGKIYVDQTTNKTYRWSGSAYVEISSSLALGETAATAYRGDRGATAYSHSQNGSVHVTEAQKAAWDAKSDFSGNYNDLSNLPTIPETYVHPSSHPASMITGLADVATSGSYNDLTDKPVIPTIPSSLPANGGNADTVDNMHASDFATADHSHSGYADSDHTHSEYFSANGGTIGGETNVAGVLRVQDQQAFYYNTAVNSQVIGTDNATGGTTICCGSSATVGVHGAMMKTPMVLPKTNNAYTCGNANFRWSGIYSTTAVNVSSDERLKRDIKGVDADSFIDFIDRLNVVTYNYKDDPADAKARIGLIAQQVKNAGPSVADYFVTEDENGMLGLKSADLVFALILAVQKLTAEVEELKANN